MKAGNLSLHSHNVRVDLSHRSYDIEIGTGNLVHIGNFVQSRVTAHQAIIVTDNNVDLPHADVVADHLTESGATVDILVVDAGEPSKSIATAESLWEQLLALHADRKSIIVAVGGGVVGDLAGFVAATYARGIACFQIPTTLLSQVDSSVGGKVGINLPNSKNMVGAFWQPQGVLIDTEVLATLPDREYRAGLAEVVKYGVILDEEFFDYLENAVQGLHERQPEVLRHVILRSCQLKAKVVQADERETSGERAVLNFGHTFCHAIETVTGYDQLLHGEAVSIGMLCAARLSREMGRVEAGFTKRLQKLLVALQLPIDVPDVEHDQLLEAMQRDKKSEYGRLRFVLPTRIGHVELVSDVDSDAARAALVRQE